jgi:hypothetical protein
MNKNFALPAAAKLPAPLSVLKSAFFISKLLFADEEYFV